ncbi:cysteine desulfurase family protein [Bacillus sp. Marseille-P3661]|uniref:cysteine desulfurase family protein n=1 Tax=Bacillus sp. Marseille-P3661 TaxID=1936234 RepID=UPI000C859EC4|nr:cysteine desulfurase family protein [Bacillus sp. Marseille-P3661]
MQQPIYLDHAATTPTHPEVVAAMIPYMTENFGNPSSVHVYGRRSRHAIDEARSFIAKTIGAHENEIIFTSGGTESDNMALQGIAKAYSEKGKHIITTSIEHHAILHTCQQLENEGYEITYLDVNESGEIDLDQLRAAIKDTTILVSIMFGNNEVGTIQPIKEIGDIISSHNIIFHTDAVQAFGIQSIDVNKLHIDLMSVSAHKINGPKGIGFLYVRNGIKLIPRQFGGEQERKRRAGTENVAGIVGLKAALTISQQQMEEKVELYNQFKQRMTEVFQQENIEFSINANEAKAVLPHVFNVAFKGTNVESMLVNLDLAGIAASSGSACTAGSVDPSHVLVAMFGRDSERIVSSIRFSFGLGNTLEQIEESAYEIVKIVRRLVSK